MVASSILNLPAASAGMAAAATRANTMGMSGAEMLLALIFVLQRSTWGDQREMLTRCPGAALGVLAGAYRQAKPCSVENATKTEGGGRPRRSVLLISPWQA